MTGINKKVFLRALSWLWDRGNHRRNGGDMTKWSLWHNCYVFWVLQCTSNFPKYDEQYTWMLSQSLDDLGTTRDECLGRTRWSSPLDSTTYLYYFTSGCTPITTWSHVLSEHSMITWPCHMIWLSDLPCYLYLDSIVRLDVRNQLCECMGNSFLPGALITLEIWFT